MPTVRMRAPGFGRITTCRSLRFPIFSVYPRWPVRGESRQTSWAVLFPSSPDPQAERNMKRGEALPVARKPLYTTLLYPLCCRHLRFWAEDGFYGERTKAETASARPTVWNFKVQRGRCYQRDLSSVYLCCSLTAWLFAYNTPGKTGRIRVGERTTPYTQEVDEEKIARTNPCKHPQSSERTSEDLRV